MSAPPILCQYEGGGKWRSAARLVSTCEREFEAGSWYKMEAIDERSAKSHNHFFAQLEDIWLNLPEGITADLPSKEHLRKWCLIKSGYSNDRYIPTPSERMAREIQAIAQCADEFAIVELLPGHVVRVRQAKSQSRKEMGAKDFQASKTAVLDLASSMIGVAAGDVARNVTEAA